MENSQYQLLLVDDDENVNDALKFILEDSGFSVVQARDGLDALNKLFDGPKPDVILLDLLMPRVNGFAFMRAVEQTEFNEIPIVLISGANPRDMPDTQAKRNYVFVSKAMDPNEIIGTIRGKLFPSDPPPEAA